MYCTSGDSISVSSLSTPDSPPACKQPYTCVEIHFSIEHIQQLAQHFRMWKISTFDKNARTALLNTINQVADKKLLVWRRICYTMLIHWKCAKKYLDNKVLEILILTLEKISTIPCKNHQTFREGGRKNLWGQRITCQGLKKRLYPNELGALVGLSIYKLQKGLRPSTDSV